MNIRNEISLKFVNGQIKQALNPIGTPYTYTKVQQFQVQFKNVTFLEIHPKPRCSLRARGTTPLLSNSTISVGFATFSLSHLVPATKTEFSDIKFFLAKLEDASKYANFVWNENVLKALNSGDFNAYCHALNSTVNSTPLKTIDI